MTSEAEKCLENVKKNGGKRKKQNGEVKLEGSRKCCHGQTNSERPVPCLMLHKELRGGRRRRDSHSDDITNQVAFFADIKHLTKYNLPLDNLRIKWGRGFIFLLGRKVGGTCGVKKETTKKIITQHIYNKQFGK